MNNSINIGMITEYLNIKEFEFSFIGDSNYIIHGFSSLLNYKTSTITFVVPERSFSNFADKFRDKDIALIIISPSEKIYDCFNNIIVYDNPRKMFFDIVEKFFEQKTDESVTGISSYSDIYNKNSCISENAIIGVNCKIGYGCVIEGDVKIGDNTVIHHNVVIRNGTKIGSNCTIFSGTIIGERGFNYTIDEKGNRHMLKHYGGVLIEDNVHIGDQCCVIQGAIDDTVIKSGAKLNTMVHVAHNVVIGKNTVITAPTHICGSVFIGNNCHVGASIIRNQILIGDSAFLGLGSVVVKDVKTGEKVIGNPAKPMKQL